MTKAELIDAMSNRTLETKKVTENFLNTFIEILVQTLKNGDKLQLSNFGTFEIVDTAPRKGRNPQTKEEIIIPASKAAKFKPGKTLKDAVNHK